MKTLPPVKISLDFKCIENNGRIRNLTIPPQLFTFEGLVMEVGYKAAICKATEIYQEGNSSSSLLMRTFPKMPYS